MSRIPFAQMQRPWTPEEIARLRQGQQVGVMDASGRAMDPRDFRQQEADFGTGIVPTPAAAGSSPFASALVGPQFPDADRTVTVRGFSPSLGTMSKAEYDYAGNSFLGGRTGGQSYRDWSALQGGIADQEAAAAMAQGRRETGLGVPSAGYLSSAVLGRAMPGATPDERGLASLKLQDSAANRESLLARQLLENQGRLEQTEAAVGGRVTKPQEKAALAAEAAVAQAIQSGMTPEEAADQGRRMYQAMQSALPGLLGIGSGGAGGFTPSDQILRSLLPTTRDAKGVTSRGAFDAAALGRLTGDALTPEAVSRFAGAARAQLRPEDLGSLKSELGKQMVEAFLRTAPAEASKGVMQSRGRFDLEGLLQVEPQRSMFQDATMQLSKSLGGQAVPVTDVLKRSSRLHLTGAEQEEWKRRYAATSALLRALATQQPGG